MCVVVQAFPCLTEFFMFMVHLQDAERMCALELKNVADVGIAVEMVPI